ncbi:MAG TPA: response regulator, partial [Verrucomicrobiae bacterium]|nr:response regulator [Verrucomicrobiae bacterium]
MPVPLNILLVEDSEEDAELVVAELRRAGFEPQWKRVTTEADYRASLEDAPDLIISDFALPQFSGLRAMDLLRERGLDIPVILVTGTLGEDRAVEAMRHGMTDYLLKDRIGRLGNSVSRALEQKRLRDERRRMQDTLRESEDRYRSLVEESPDAIGIYQDGKLVFANSTGARMLGAKTKEELLGRETQQMIHPEDLPGAMDRVRRRLA